MIVAILFALGMLTALACNLATLGTEFILAWTLGVLLLAAMISELVARLSGRRPRAPIATLPGARVVRGPYRGGRRG